VRPHDEVPQVLRTSCPAVSGPEGRKTVAHDVSRGSHVDRDPQPQRGDRRGRLPCADTSREDAKTRRRQKRWTWCSGKTLAVKWDRADFKPVEEAVRECRRGRLPWRLRGLSDSCSGVLSSFGDAIGCSCSCGGRGSVAPLGLGVHGGTEPSAHALGYRLTTLRAWGHGSVGREGAWVCRDRTGFFPVGFRYRCRFRSRYRGVGPGFAGRVHRPQGACRFGGFVGWEQCPFATVCDYCGHSLGIEAKGSHAKNRPPTEAVFCSNELAIHSLQFTRRVGAPGLQRRSWVGYGRGVSGASRGRRISSVWRWARSSAMGADWPGRW
jgi:hypothetical protein